MEANEIEEFLTETRLARLATVTKENKPHVTAIWFLYKAPNVYFSTNKPSKKYRNMISNKNVAIIIDAEKNKKEKGVIIEGAVEEITDEALLNEIKEKLYLKYLGRLDHPMIKVFEGMPGRVWMKIKTVKRISWDYSKSFNTKSEQI
ncbi:MAG: pyridoxamine 5'-phosphate oxidase family protein [Candidatus Helarchaeales archaeon]